MDLTHFKEKLLDKERELEDEITRLKGESRSVDVEVEDPADRAEADQTATQTLDEATALTHTLEEVRDALLRIEQGTYGRCMDCGRQIERARLEAVPWTTYCLKDQEKRSSRRTAAQGSSL